MDATSLNPLIMLSETASMMKKRKHDQMIHPIKKVGHDFLIVFQPGVTLPVWFRWKKVRSLEKMAKNILHDLHFVTYGNYGEVHVTKLLSNLIDEDAAKIPENMMVDARKNAAFLKDHFCKIWQEQINRHSKEERQEAYDKIIEKIGALNDADAVARKKQIQKTKYKYDNVTVHIDRVCRQVLFAMIETVVWNEVGDIFEGRVVSASA